MRTLFVIIFTTSVNLVYAQVAIGIYGGLDKSKFSGDSPNNYSYEFKSGYVVGLSFDVGIEKDVFLSIRPNYTQGGVNIAVRGYDIIVPALSPSDPTDTVFQYPVTNHSIALPVIVQVHVTRGFYAISGIDLSYVLSSKANVNGSELGISEKLNRYLICGIFGFGGSVPIGRTSINLEFTYAQGLNTLTKKDYILEGSPRIRTRCIRVSTYFKVFGSRKKL